jgi:hypothetical protein
MRRQRRGRDRARERPGPERPTSRYRGWMASTVLESEPSRRAMALATAIILGGTTYLALRYKKPIIRAATPLALSLGVQPLARVLTRLGVV